MKTLWTFGNAYRAALVSPELRDKLGSDLGRLAFEQEARLFHLPVEPTGDIGAAVGTWATPGMVDPRGEFGTKPWSFWLTSGLYHWNP